MYPIVCGRLRREENTGMKVNVQRDKGFQLVETNSDFTLFQAISKARVTDQVAEFPSLAQLPFFMADMDCHTFYNEESPLFSVKLVHYKDNTCSLATTIRHYICDGKRLIDLSIDLAHAFCNQPLRKVDNDGSKLCPDVFLHKVDIDLCPRDFPRRINSSLKDKFTSIPGETYSIEKIYFPRRDLESLKAKVMEQLTEEGSYLSLSHLVTAVQWMLQCELNVLREAKPRSVNTALDLGIAGTTFLFTKGFASEDTTLLPSNYFGNAYLFEVVQYQESEIEEQRSCNLLDTLVETSHTVRRAILASRPVSCVASELVKLYEGCDDPEISTPFVGLLSSVHKMGFDKIDFQGGPPVYSYIPQSYPFPIARGTFSANGNGIGMILNTVIPTADLENALNSAVLKELCPEARFLSQMAALQFCECCVGTPRLL